MDDKIKFATLEHWSEEGDEEGDYTDSLPQHAFVSRNGIATSICNKSINPIDEDEKPMRFYELETELKASTTCQECCNLVGMLESRETEVQIAYDSSAGAIASLYESIEEKEEELRQLKLSLIKEESSSLKIEQRAEQLGIKDFL